MPVALRLNGVAPAITSVGLVADVTISSVHVFAAFAFTETTEPFTVIVPL